jgi:NAD(P)-dependent dehydrogenase (short-subunit alcohol dehydrogenase family)
MAVSSSKQRTILVTGATSGIGYATAAKLIASGLTVVAVGRNQARLEQMAMQWGEQCTTRMFDLLRVDRLDELAASIPKIDGAVMSAGIVKNNPIKFFDRESFNEILQLNLISPLLLSIALSNAKRINVNASIVFLSSTNGTTVGIKGTLAYATSKAGLTGAAKVLALELSGKGIRVNCVAPGMVATEMVTNLSQMSEDMIKTDMSKYPLGKRYAKPSEIADVIAFLLSEESSFITGQTVTVDGGYCIQ